MNFYLVSQFKCEVNRYLWVQNQVCLISSFIFAAGSYGEVCSWDLLLWKVFRERISRMIMQCEYVGNVSVFSEYIRFLIIKMPWVFFYFDYYLVIKVVGQLFMLKGIIFIF